MSSTTPTAQSNDSNGETSTPLPEKKVDFSHLDKLVDSIVKEERKEPYYAGVFLLDDNYAFSIKRGEETLSFEEATYFLAQLLDKGIEVKGDNVIEGTPYVITLTPLKTNEVPPTKYGCEINDFVYLFTNMKTIIFDLVFSGEVAIALRRDDEMTVLAKATTPSSIKNRVLNQLDSLVSQENKSVGEVESLREAADFPKSSLIVELLDENEKKLATKRKDRRDRMIAFINSCIYNKNYTLSTVEGQKTVTIVRTYLKNKLARFGSTLILDEMDTDDFLFVTEFFKMEKLLLTNVKLDDAGVVKITMYGSRGKTPSTTSSTSSTQRPTQKKPIGAGTNTITKLAVTPTGVTTQSEEKKE